jgi:hypothetical protein
LARTKHFIRKYGGLPAETLDRDRRRGASFFPLLGAKTTLGRTFDASEDAPIANPTVVLSYLYWRNHFGGNSSIVGKTIVLDGKPTAVIGVLSPDFKFFPRQTDLYMPIGLMGSQKVWLDRGNHPGMHVLARLKAGVTRYTALTDMNTIMARLEAQYPVSNSGPARDGGFPFTRRDSERCKPRCGCSWPQWVAFF